MIPIVLIDDHGGMQFNRRRQSRDRLACADILRLCAGAPLWLAPRSVDLFPDAQQRLIPAPDFLEKAGTGAFCLVEDRPLLPQLDRIEALYLYRWNRVYPADLYLDLIPAQHGFRLADTTEFAGSSHEKITRDHYIQGE